MRRLRPACNPKVTKPRIRILPAGALHWVQSETDSFVAGRHLYTRGSFARSLEVVAELHRLDITNESPPPWLESTFKEAIIEGKEVFNPSQYEQMVTQMGRMSELVHDGHTEKERKSYKSLAKFCKAKAGKIRGD